MYAIGLKSEAPLPPPPPPKTEAQLLAEKKEEEDNLRKVDPLTFAFFHPIASVPLLCVAKTHASFTLFVYSAAGCPLSSGVSLKDPLARDPTAPSAPASMKLTRSSHRLSATSYGTRNRRTERMNTSAGTSLVRALL